MVVDWRPVDSKGAAVEVRISRKLVAWQNIWSKEYVLVQSKEFEYAPNTTPMFRYRTQIPTLFTTQLELRGMQRSDVAALYELLGLPEVGQWLGAPDGFTRVQTQQWIDGILFWWDKHGYGPWGLVEREKGVLVGYCGLKFAEELGASELLYAIHPNYQGGGMATEAAMASVRFGFETLGLDQIAAMTLTNNLGSRRVLEKLGMQLVASLQRGYTEHVHYTLLRKQWQQAHHGSR